MFWTISPVPRLREVSNGPVQFAGFCPPKTKCYFNEENQSPYCI